MKVRPSDVVGGRLVGKSVHTFVIDEAMPDPSEVFAAVQALAAERTPDGRHLLPNANPAWRQTEAMHWVKMRARLHELLGKDAQTKHLQQEYNRVEALLRRGTYRPIGSRRLAGHR